MKCVTLSEKKLKTSAHPVTSLSLAKAIDSSNSEAIYLDLAMWRYRTESEQQKPHGAQWAFLGVG